MDKKVKIVYNKLNNLSFTENGYIDLRESKIKDKKALVDVCNIFRDPRYETFRIFYMKENQIVGQEIITSKLPNAVIVFSNGKDTKNNPIRCFEKMNNRMKRLSADGYYLVHNHISDSANPSVEDMEITRDFEANVNGFLGHIILGNSNKYCIIEKDLKGRIVRPVEKVLNDSVINKTSEKLKEKGLYDVRISCREELVAILKHIQQEKDYSIAILTDCKCNIRMILNVPNNMFNQDVVNLNGFFKNLARNSGSTRVFIGTNDKTTYDKVLKHIDYGTIKDMVCIDQSGNLVIDDFIMSNEDLFDKEKRNKIKNNGDAR